MFTHEFDADLHDPLPGDLPDDASSDGAFSPPVDGHLPDDYRQIDSLDPDPDDQTSAPPELLADDLDDEPVRGGTSRGPATRETERGLFAGTLSVEGMGQGADPREHSADAGEVDHLTASRIATEPLGEARGAGERREGEERRDEERLEREEGGGTADAAGGGDFIDPPDDADATPADDGGDDDEIRRIMSDDRPANMPPLELTMPTRAELAPEAREELATRAAAVETAPHIRLGERNQEVLTRLARGDNMTAIADDMGLTREALGRGLFKAMGVRTQAQAVNIATRHGLIEMTAPEEGAARPELTPKQEQLLFIAAQGYTRDQAAESTGVGKGTVDGQHDVIMEKLGVHTMTEAIARARAAGIMPGAEVLEPGQATTHLPIELQRHLWSQAARIESLPPDFRLDEDPAVDAQLRQAAANIVVGRSGEESAQDLGVHRRTQVRLVGQLRDRLGVDNPPGIAYAALFHRLVEPPTPLGDAVPELSPNAQVHLYAVGVSGLEREQLATAMGVTEGTVQAAQNGIRAQLGVNTMGAAVGQAFAHRIFRPFQQ